MKGRCNVRLSDPTYLRQRFERRSDGLVTHTKGRPIKSATARYTSRHYSENATAGGENRRTAATNFPTRKSRSPIRRRGEGFCVPLKGVIKVKVTIKVAAVAAVNPGPRSLWKTYRLRLHVESLPVLISLRPPNSTNPGWHCMVTNTLRHVFRRTNHTAVCPYLYMCVYT